MEVLMISNDKRIYDAGSEPAKRMAMLGDLTDGLRILILGLGGGAVRISPKAEVVPLGSNKLLSVLNALFIAEGLNRKNTPVADIITTQDAFLAGLAGFFLKKIFKIKLQLQVHTDVMSRFFREESFVNRLRYWLALFLIPRADCVRVVSGRIRYSLIRKFPGLKISVLPVFVDVERIKKAGPRVNLRHKYPQYDFIILMASRFTKEKNIDLALSMMAEVVKKYPRAGLIVVGCGRLEKEYLLKMKSLGLSESVRIEPWSEDIISYYKTADLFLLTSNYEGYGLALAEAVISGCPAVSTDVGAALEIIRNGENGFIVKVGDRNGLIEVILKLINDRKMTERFRQFNINAADRWYSRAAYFENYTASLSQC